MSRVDTDRMGKHKKPPKIKVRRDVAIEVLEGASNVK